MSEDSQIKEPVAAKKTSGMGIAALVLGCVGIVGSWIPILNNVSFFVALLGAIFGAIGIISIYRSKGEKGGKGLAIAGTIVSVVAMIVVLYTQSMYGKAIDEASNSINEATTKYEESSKRMSGEATEEILNKDVTVDFGEYTVDTKSYGSTTSQNGYLAVTVKNLASESKSYTIHLEAVDASGTRIEDGYVYASNLAAGQSKSENIFSSYGEDYIAKYKNATFKIVEVRQY